MKWFQKSGPPGLPVARIAKSQATSVAHYIQAEQKRPHFDIISIDRHYERTFRISHDEVFSRPCGPRVAGFWRDRYPTATKQSHGHTGKPRTNTSICIIRIECMILQYFVSVDDFIPCLPSSFGCFSFFKPFPNVADPFFNFVFFRFLSHSILTVTESRCSSPEN